jgi:hypothetical protein
MTGPTTINTGVCQSWTDPDAILGCCNAQLPTDVDLDQAGLLASDLLYEISGHRFPGLCDTTVRGCGSEGGCFDNWVPTGHVPYQWYLGPWGFGAPWAWHSGRDCSCRGLSKVRLAGYPVREIQEVSIDGVVLDPAEYELRTDRYLIRMADANGNPQRWPSCQRMDIDEGIGTFFIHYRYGLAPPLAGERAAAQLACQIAKACLNEECEIPQGTVRIARQGLTIDATQLGLWLIGTMRTGMPLVDAFISIYGGQRQQRRTALSVPELDPWPVRVG